MLVAMEQFKVGTRVNLVPSQASIGNAMYGPLESASDVGVITVCRRVTTTTP